jgi:hypothetical protein
MDTDISPSDAVDVDDGSGAGAEAVQEATEDHAAAEGAESSSSSLGSTSTIQEMLLSTEPETPLARVDSPWNPEEGGITRVYRGLRKMLGFSGMPAVVDVVIGAAEFIHEFEPDVDERDDQDDGDDQLAEFEGAEVA